MREDPVCDMPYGRAILAGFIIFGHWIFVRSTPVVKGVGESEREGKHSGDLRSLHFPSEYHATGVLSLPTSNINEPFEVWHSQTYDKSRIDYYHGKRNILIPHLNSHCGSINEIVMRYLPLKIKCFPTGFYPKQFFLVLIEKPSVPAEFAKTFKDEVFFTSYYSALIIK